MWKHKRPWITKAIQSKRITLEALPYPVSRYKHHSNWHKNRNVVDWNRRPRLTSIQIQPHLTRMLKTYNGKKDIFTSVGKLDVDMQKNKNQTLSSQPYQKINSKALNIHQKLGNCWKGRQRVLHKMQIQIRTF